MGWERWEEGWTDGMQEGWRDGDGTRTTGQIAVAESRLQIESLCEIKIQLHLSKARGLSEGFGLLRSGH